MNRYKTFFKDCNFDQLFLNLLFIFKYFIDLISHLFLILTVFCLHIFDTFCQTIDSYGTKKRENRIRIKSESKQM